MDRQITSHLILTVQRYVEGLLPTISNSYCNLQVAICPLHRFPFLVHLPRSPPLPPAAPAPAIRRRRRGARCGGGDRLEGSAVGRDPGSCGGVPNCLGDSLAVSLIEAQFEPLFLLPLQLGRAELRSDPK